MAALEVVTCPDPAIGELLIDVPGVLGMTPAGAHTTVLVMQTRTHKSRIGEPQDPGPQPFAELRRRNERRARVAQLLAARNDKLERIVQAATKRSGRHAD
jgi:hypothetical protein